MITVKLTGDRELIGKLNAMPTAVQQALLKKTTSLALQLEALVKQKLSGQVLKVGTGNLRDSIHNDVNATDTSVTGRVFSDKSVKYAAIHEYGGTTGPHDIVPVKAQALAFLAGGICATLAALLAVAVLRSRTTSQASSAPAPAPAEPASAGARA